MAYTISYLPTNTAATPARRFFVADTYAELPTASPAVDGDAGYAKDTNAFYSYNGTSWGTVIHATTSDPASPSVGEIWIRTDL
jgi:hypothetical protein